MTGSVPIEVHRLDRGGWWEILVSAVVHRPIDRAAGLRELFERLSAELAKAKIEILIERIYGAPAAMDRVLTERARARKAAGLDPDQPVTYVAAPVCRGGWLAGLHLLGAAAGRAPVQGTPVRQGEKTVGRALQVPQGRLVALSGVGGGSGAAGETAPVQADRMFSRLRELLAQGGAAGSDLFRTWIHFPRLLAWYGDFNRVRSRHYREVGLEPSPEGRGPPASTGVGGARAPGEECFLDALAFAPAPGSRGRIDSILGARQRQAWEYGSLFSRGMALVLDGPPTLFVSGTASIDREGRTVAVGDAAGQVRDAMANLESHLEAAGAGLADVRQATAFCRDPEVYRAFLEVMRELGLEQFPAVAIQADICRQDLLFELDAVAARR